MNRIIVLAGDELEIINSKRKLVNEHLQIYGQGSVSSYELSDVDLDQIDFNQSSGLFNEVMMLCFRNSKTTDAALKNLIEILKKINNELVLIIYGEFDKRSSAYKWLTVNSDFKDLKPEHQEIINILGVNLYTKIKNISGADSLVLKSLAEQYQNSADVAENDFINYFVNKNSTDRALELFNACLRKDQKTIKNILDDLHTLGVDPLKTLGLLLWNLNISFIANHAGNAAELATKTGFNEYSINKTKQNRQSRLDHKKIITIILEAEKNIKTKPVDAQNMLRNIAYGISIAG